MKLMQHIILLVFILIISTLGAESTISFSASNDITLESVELDSIIVKNITKNKTVVLTNTTTFDLETMTNVRSGAIQPTRFQLSGNYPNAFKSQTHFHVNVPDQQFVSLSVYNVLGQQVASYQHELAKGAHAFTLNGASLANGVYFIRAVTGQESSTVKILKSGPSSGTGVALHYAGADGAINNKIASLTKVNKTDVYHFIGIAKNFYPDTLKNQQPHGGDHFQFKVLPEPPEPDFTSNWKGFNLLGKFTLEWSNEGYMEKDLEMISDLGFNFVRLPIDYRTYCETGDWFQFIENELQEIDDAISWGQEYGIHVCINLHRAPGYCVNPPSDPLPPNEDVSLWENAEAQQAFTEHWAMFAERYKDVPSEDLSFNLVNEPANVDGPTYLNAVKGAIEAIQDITPNRIIMSDGVDWGNARVDDILEYGVVMSPHFYNPFQLTHYKASWADGSDTWPEPQWPIYPMANYFYGSYKEYIQTPLVINGYFPSGTEITLHVQQVSTRADFSVRTKESTVWHKVFEPGPGDGEWKKVIYREEWNCYQNIYDRDYSMTLEHEATELSFLIGNGDWMTFSELRLNFPGSRKDVVINPGISDWGVPQATYQLAADGTLSLIKAPAGHEHRFRLNGFLAPWVELKEQGVPVFVGEWGVYNKTPHDVTIRFMRDRLKAMKSAGLGWALWNFRGSFGILDSGRDDVDYENYRGHKLDREMLELLQNY